LERVVLPAHVLNEHETGRIFWGLSAFVKNGQFQF